VRLFSSSAKGVVGLLVVAAPLLASGCGGNGSGAPAGVSAGGTGAAHGSAAAQSAPPTSASPVALLAVHAGRIRGQVDRLVAALGTGAARTLLLDEAAPCTIGSTSPGWPQRWGYAIEVTLPKVESAAPAARNAGSTLRGGGWQVRSHPSTQDVADLDAVKDGAKIHIVGGETPGGLTVEAYSDCIGADGAVVG